MTLVSEPAARPQPRAQRSRNQNQHRRSWLERLLITAGVLGTVGLLLIAAVLSWGLVRYRDINFVAVAGVEAAPSGEPSNWLLVGSDSRDGIDPDDPNSGAFLGEEISGKRTDTMIIARVNPGDQTIDLLSIPRDLWVPIAGQDGNGRVNSAFNGDGGEERLVSTIQQALDIPINHYAEINFVGFQEIIDALGGVPIWFDTAMRDTHSGLNVETAGCHTLSGSEALAFARSRYLEFNDGSGWQSDPTGDLGRTARQQYLLSRLAHTASGQIGPTNLGTVNTLLKVGGENLMIDDGAGAGDLLGLARAFANAGGDGIRRHALPVENFRTSGGAAVLSLQEEAAKPTLDLFQGLVPPPGQEGPTDETVAVDSFTVDVENGAGIAGIAGDTAASLRTSGFTVGRVDNAPAPVEQTVVRYPSAQAAAATTLGRHLATGPQFEVDESLGSVVLVIGPDFSGIGDGSTEVAVPPPSAGEEGAAPPPVQEPGENEVGVVPGPTPAGTACE